MSDTQTLPATRTGADVAEHIVTPNLALLADPEGAEAEAISALRTSLVSGAIGQGTRSLALCGAHAGSGVSGVAANLAAAFAQAGLRTLLIDGDLHSSGLDAYFSVDGKEEVPGLLQCLSGAVERIDRAILPVMPDLSLLRSGGRAENAQELLSGQALGSLIDHCLRSYDITLIDTPPANISADARRIAANLGHALIVVRRNASYLADVNMLRSELEADRVNVVGSVLTT